MGALIVLEVRAEDDGLVFAFAARDGVTRAAGLVHGIVEVADLLVVALEALRRLVDDLVRLLGPPTAGVPLEVLSGAHSVCFGSAVRLSKQLLHVGRQVADLPVALGCPHRAFPVGIPARCRLPTRTRLVVGTLVEQAVLEACVLCDYDRSSAGVGGAIHVHLADGLDHGVGEASTGCVGVHHRGEVQPVFDTYFDAGPNLVGGRCLGEPRTCGELADEVVDDAPHLLT